MDEQSYPIPEKYRASLDITDEQAYELLKKSDAQQKIWAKRVNSPFTRTNPRESARSKALITIQTLSATQVHQKLHPEQIEQLAEAWACVGRYDLAIETTKNKDAKAHYKAIWAGVWLDDSKWCKHPPKHTFIKEYVFSLKEGKELPLLKCNVCGAMNVLDCPDELQARQASHLAHQGKATHKSIADAKQYHLDNVKRG